MSVVELTGLESFTRNVCVSEVVKHVRYQPCYICTETDKMVCRVVLLGLEMKT
jgi:hypothetical protein